MRTPLVVIEQERMCSFTRFIEVVEEVQIEHGVTERTVEAFDEGILIGFPRLDVTDLNGPFGAPRDEALREKLRPVVAANGPRVSAPGNNVIQHPHDPLSADRGIDLDGKPLTGKVIDDIKRAKGPDLPGDFRTV